MKAAVAYFILFSLTVCNLKGQSAVFDTTYERAYLTTLNMLSNKEALLFKKAVFLTENAFLETKLSYDDFETSIQSLISLGQAWIKANPLLNYHNQDSTSVHGNGAIFALLTDTITIKFIDATVKKHYPFTYDFDDSFADQDWRKMFVTKLLVTNSGNCHSLPYLYKILADEMGVKNCWLSFAPSHIYIKNRCQKIGWYNTELTSGEHPLDAWIMASGYISTDAIRSGIYMDTLSSQQAVANCVLDLAKGYERKYKLYTDSFIIRCCDLTLKYHPNNINAIIYKAETLKKMYQIYQKVSPALTKIVYLDMEKLYIQAMDLGYKEMPGKMYKEWLRSMATQKKKYSNRKVHRP